MADRITAKERQVLQALQSGLYLRRKQFSDLWEVAPSLSNPILTTRSRSNAKFTVNRMVIENLQQRGLIRMADSKEFGRSLYVATETGLATL